jgi:hypothetical protein
MSTELSLPQSRTAVDILASIAAELCFQQVYKIKVNTFSINLISKKIKKFAIYMSKT